jgi:HK97 family phage major capsid protein
MQELEVERQKAAELDKAILSHTANAEKVEKGILAAAKKDAELKGRMAEFAIGDEADASGHYGTPADARRELLEKSSKGNDELREFHDWSDEIYLKSHILKRQGVDIRRSPVYKRGVSRFAKFVKALDPNVRKYLATDTSSYGTEWIPTQFSGELFDIMRLARRTPQLFRNINMPSAVYTLPTMLTDSVVYLVPESASDSASDMTASSPTTGSVSLTSKKLACESWFSEEMTEDSITPVIEMLRQNLAEAHATGIEDAIISGDDTAAGHQDFALVTTSTDRRKAFKGLRKLASAGSDTTTCGGDALTDTDVINGILAMGKYGVDPSQLVLLCGAKGYAKLRAISNVWTVDKSGAKAALVTGVLKDIAGVEVVVTPSLLDLYNASGVYDATTQTTGVIVLAHKPSFVLGLRRAMKIRSWEKIQTEQTVMTCSSRVAFAKLRATTEPTCQTLYNFTIAAA